MFWSGWVEQWQGLVSYRSKQTSWCDLANILFPVCSLLESQTHYLSKIKSLCLIWNSFFIQSLSAFPKIFYKYLNMWQKLDNNNYLHKHANYAHKRLLNRNSIKNNVHYRLIHHTDRSWLIMNYPKLFTQSSITWYHTTKSRLNWLNSSNSYDKI